MPVRVLVALVLSFVPMAGEAMRSRRHERLLRARGAIEPAGDVHGLMRVAYPGAFLAMAIEGWWRARPLDAWFYGGLALWVLSKGLKYCAIRALGPSWSFRLLAVPGAALVAHGPYRFLRHPNYAAVVGELLATMLLCPAPWTGPAALASFGTLLWRRIALEDAVLGAR